jgi:hypothetical protein
MPLFSPVGCGDGTGQARWKSLPFGVYHRSQGTSRSARAGYSAQRAGMSRRCRNPGRLCGCHCCAGQRSRHVRPEDECTSLEVDALTGCIGQACVVLFSRRISHSIPGIKSSARTANTRAYCGTHEDHMQRIVCVLVQTTRLAKE